VRGFDNVQTGALMALTGAVQFLSTPMAGLLSRRLDHRLMPGIGLAPSRAMREGYSFSALSHPIFDLTPRAGRDWGQSLSTLVEHG
jgi:hypothetical protein